MLLLFAVLFFKILLCFFSHINLRVRESDEIFFSLFSDVQPQYLRISLDLITIYERDPVDLRSSQIVESSDDDDGEVPLFLTRSFCRNPETGGHLLSKPFCFDRRGVDHRLPLSQNHDLLRVIEEDH